MKAIEVISIPVSDQSAAKEFYRKLGFEILRETPFGPNQQWIQLGLPGAATSITLVNWFEEMQPGCIHGLVVETDNIEQEAQLLREKGVNISTIDQTPWGAFAQFSDPDGNTWSLRQSA